MLFVIQQLPREPWGKENASMGLFKKTFQVVGDVTSLGGTYRMRNQASRYTQLRETYDRLQNQIAEVNADLLAAVVAVKNRVRISTRHLRSAASILRPFGIGAAHGLNGVKEQRSLVQTASVASATQGDFRTMNTNVPTGVGAGAGVGVAVGSWGAVQVIGHASTGAAMAGLHGAAAANAGWAWFGGGSLATGGGGMTAGHFVLPGIGTALALAISSTISHREANRISKYCDELEGVNQKNSSALAKVRSDLSSVKGLEAKLRSEDRLLYEALKAAKRKVRRFGLLSHVWRLIRYWVKGYYYTREEFSLVAKLDAAVLRFVSAFRSV
jgi:hypothetical protein